MPVVTHNNKARTLFVHIPKTSGMYIETILRRYGTVSGTFHKITNLHGLPCSPQHFHKELLELIFSTNPSQPESDFSFSFMVVRHPVERILSEFRYRTQYAPRNERNADQWVSDAIHAAQEDPYTLDNHIRPQHQFETFNCEVFHYEDPDLYKKIEQRLRDVSGVNVEHKERMPVNATLRGGETLSPSTRRLVETYYEKDFQKYYPSA